MEVLIIVGIIVVVFIVVSKSRQGPRIRYTPSTSSTSSRRSYRYYEKPYDWKKVASRDGMACSLCGEDVDPHDYYMNTSGIKVTGRMYPSVDHIEPQSWGGDHDDSNLRLAHKSCNSARGDRWDVHSMPSPDDRDTLKQEQRDAPRARAEDPGSQIAVIARCAIRAVEQSATGEITIKEVQAIVALDQIGRAIEPRTVNVYIAAFLNADSPACSRPLLRRVSRGVYRLAN